MSISDDGGHWGGDSSPIINPDSIVRLAFLFQGEPFVLDIQQVFFLNQAMNMAR